MRPVKRLTMYLWDVRPTASGSHQAIAALEKLLFQRRVDRGRPATAGIGPPGRIGGAGGSGESLPGTATLCTSGAGGLRGHPRWLGRLVSRQARKLACPRAGGDAAMIDEALTGVPACPQAHR
jgi:hypothetical protein